jgi:hypothetical protein
VVASGAGKASVSGEDLQRNRFLNLPWGENGLSLRGIDPHVQAPHRRMAKAAFVAESISGMPTQLNLIRSANTCRLFQLDCERGNLLCVVYNLIL